MTALERIFEAIEAKTKELGYNLKPVPNNVRTFGEGLHNLAPGIWEGLYLDPSKGMLVLLVNTTADVSFANLLFLDGEPTPYRPIAQDVQIGKNIFVVNVSRHSSQSFERVLPLPHRPNPKQRQDYHL